MTYSAEILAMPSARGNEFLDLIDREGSAQEVCGLRSARGNFMHQPDRAMRVSEYASTQALQGPHEMPVQSADRHVYSVRIPRVGGDPSVINRLSRKAEFLREEST